MKTKFISLIASAAVILGLMLVPAALPTAVSADPGVNEWAYEITDEAVTKVTPGESFTVNITCVQLSDGVSDGWEAYVRYDPTYLTVSGIDIPSNLPPPNSGPVDWYPDPEVYDLLSPTDCNDTEGILYAGYSPKPKTPKLNETFWFATVHFDVAGVVPGTVTTYLNFTNGGPYAKLVIWEGATPLQKWSAFVNGTVMIGSPTLTVDVTTAGIGEPKYGEVTISGTGGTITPTSYPNETSCWKWDEEVDLEAVNPAPGWRFDSWTGPVDNASAVKTFVTMSDDKSVVANFVEKPPELFVDPLSLDFTGGNGVRAGDNEASAPVKISNTGGGTLNWIVGSPPEWWQGDSWLWANIYGVPTNNVSMVVVDNTTDPDNYIAFANFIPSVTRTLNTTQGLMNVSMINATVLVDKYTLDIVQMDANMSVIDYGGVPATACVTYEFFGDHGWPYSLGKNWSYNATSSLTIPVIPLTLTEPPVTAYANVTAFTATVTPDPSIPLAVPCYEITHYNSTFYPGMWTYWNDTVRNFVVTVDGATYAPPPYPPDIRVYLGSSVGAPAPPEWSWLNVSPTSGSLVGNKAISGFDTITVTVNASGLDVGIQPPGNFTITAPGTAPKTVEVAFEVLTAERVDVTRTITVSTVLGKPGETTELYPGETFDVYVTFKSPTADFNAIGLTDLAPAGWEVEVDPEWCVDPQPYAALATGNKAEYLWSGPYDTDTPFTAMYKVTVPTTATPGTNSFATETEMDKAWLEYYFGLSEAYKSPILGDPEVNVTVPGDIVGLTREVNHDDLSNVDVTIYRVTDGIVIGTRGGVAEWSTDQSRSGKSSVYLEAGTPGGANASMVLIEVDPIAIANFSGASYYVWEPSGIQHQCTYSAGYYPWGNPYINILLDTNNDGVYDDVLEGIGSKPCPPETKMWVEMAEGYGFYDGDNSFGSGMTIDAAGNLTEWQAWFAGEGLTPTVVGIRIIFGFWLDNPVTGVYVDDVTINGITYDLESSKVALRGESAISSPDYVDTAYVTGQYSVVASKTRFSDIDTAHMVHLAPLYIDLGDEDKLADGATFNFSGDYGLIPRACTMSYAMQCVNLWVCTDVLKDMYPDEWQEWALSDWKALNVVHSWRVPS